MATAAVVNAQGEWIRRGIHKTTWANMTITTTGDVGTPQNSMGGMTILSVQVSGTMTSDSVIQFQEANGATLTYSVAQTVCGTNLAFGSATGSNLSTGTVYLVRPGASHYRPKITAGASGAEDLTVTFIQSV